MGLLLYFSYLWGDIIDIVVSSLSSSLLSLTGEVVYILVWATSRPQAGRDVIDLLGGLDDSAPVSVIMLVSQDWGRDIVHIFWNGGLIIVVEVVVWILGRDRDLGLEFGKVGWYVVGLLSDWLSIRNVFTDRWGEVIDLKTEGEKYMI